MTPGPTRPWPAWIAPVPGLAVVALLAAGAAALAERLPAGVSPVTIGVVAGLVLANVVRLPAALDPGIRFAVTVLLRLGIVLLGTRLSLGAVLDTSLGAVVMVLAAAAFAFVVVMAASRRFGLPPRLSLLIAVGTAICGNSAIIATAPIIRASHREVSFAVATITLFGTAAVLVYPVVGHLLGISDPVFGHWAGVAVNDTSQVTATGFAYSTTAGETATVVKLTRNLLIGPVLVGIALLYEREGARPREQRASSLQRISRAVPLFVIGFVLAAALNSLGLVPAPMGARLEDAAAALILAALVGVGLGTRLVELREIGFRPFAVGSFASVALALVALALAQLTSG